MGMILGTYPDAAMDIVGTVGGKFGKAVDDFYDDVTRFENPNPEEYLVCYNSKFSYLRWHQ